MDKSSAPLIFSFQLLLLALFEKLDLFLVKPKEHLVLCRLWWCAKSTQEMVCEGGGQANEMTHRKRHLLNFKLSSYSSCFLSRCSLSF